MSLSAHDGTAWRRSKTVYANNGAWRQCISVHAHDGTSWRKTYGCNYSANHVSDTFFGATDSSFFVGTITDLSGNTWTATYFHNGVNANKTHVVVAAEVPDTYWDTMTWTGRGSLTRSARDSSSQSGGTTTWIFTGDGLALGTWAGQPAVNLTIA